MLNRRGFQELLEDWLSDRRHGARDEQNRDGALLLIGVHGIKSVNDSFGHSAGDDVLRNALSRMDAATGRYPFARLTGDECAVLVTDAAELDDVRGGAAGGSRSAGAVARHRRAGPTVDGAAHIPATETTGSR